MGHGIIHLGVPYNLHVANDLKNADVMGVAQNHIYFSFQCHNTVKIKIQKQKLSWSEWTSSRAERSFE